MKSKQHLTHPPGLPKLMANNFQCTFCFQAVISRCWYWNMFLGMCKRLIRAIHLNSYFDLLPLRALLVRNQLHLCMQYFFHFKNNLVQTSRDRRSGVCDKSPFSIKVSIPWFEHKLTKPQKTEQTWLWVKMIQGLKIAGLFSRFVKSCHLFRMRYRLMHFVLIFLCHWVFLKMLEFQS